MSRSARSGGHRSAPRASRARRRTYRTRTSGAAITLTILGALLPGLGFILAGRRKLGAAVLTGFLGLIALGAYLALAQRNTILELAVDPNRLLIATALVVLLSAAWIVVVVASHKMLRPLTPTVTGRLVGASAVGVLCFAIAVPTTVAAQTVMAQRNLVGAVFQSEGHSKSATRPKVNKQDPWANTPRLNILLLGADDGAGRTGARTDTVMVASIDTRTGDTKLISLSRNWMRMPFPASSPLHKVYPNGFWDPNLGNTEQPQYYLDAMYDTVPKAHPGILGPTDNMGADVLKLSVGAALGLDIDYYMQVNLAGFQQIVDAVGGITVNVNYRVPIGGEYGIGPGANAPKPPSAYIEPGPEQKLDGFHALWFARGRYGLSDPSRQERQRCTIHALVNGVNPATLVTKYQQIAAASQEMLRTDIPQELLPALTQLALKVKTAGVSNIDLNKDKNFPTGRDPNYAGMRAIIQKALTAQPTATATSTSGTGKTTSGTATTPPSRGTGSAKRHTTSASPSTQSLNDACAYHPEPGGS
ncbi:LCP family protein [Kribbella solani]|uniref:LCP family protein required for cell wall assembly n=1 Tax=Kribbella solani TaxID=236067 RepID=A0A841DIM3_9ACTN|nr:LCP family protein [Kribbella solani]MBB5978352.1 LCP family protein required for cell wall assembly [Kribbella solani]